MVSSELNFAATSRFRWWTILYYNPKVIRKSCNFHKDSFVQWTNDKKWINFNYLENNFIFNIHNANEIICSINETWFVVWMKKLCMVTKLYFEVLTIRFGSSATDLVFRLTNSDRFPSVCSYYFIICLCFKVFHRTPHKTKRKITLYILNILYFNIYFWYFEILQYFCCMQEFLSSLLLLFFFFFENLILFFYFFSEAFPFPSPTVFFFK